MLNFLRQSRKFLNSKKDTCIVIGNESCDLDSACSALCLAFFYQEFAKESQSVTKQFLPVLNIPRRDYPLKTEVCFLLKKYEISESVLTFRDELEEDFLDHCDFILVDHHVSPFASRCVAVFDHRPRDKSANFQPQCKVTMEFVGSCATLVAETIISTSNDNSCTSALEVPFNLLRNTIILDTVNFEPTASRFTPKDQHICDCLEKFLNMNDNVESRDEVFKNLQQARANVSDLTAAQLLRKDLKILKSTNGNIALPGFPLKIEMFLAKSDAEKAVKAFAVENNCNIVMLLGMFVNDKGLVERDIGLISFGESRSKFDLIEERLVNSTDPLLQLEREDNCKFLNGHFYRQANIKATRKHMLPILKKALEE